MDSTLAGPSGPSKRTRESTSKVKTGCSTCKARRVKCDEGKPVCNRCMIGGRTCDYTTPQQTRPTRTVVKMYMPPTATIQRQPSPLENSIGLDFFHQRLAAKLDGQFNSSFWSTLVMRMTQTEPAIRHAVSALSVIHRDVDQSMTSSEPGFITADPVAMQHWHKAMRCLAARIKDRPTSKFVPLVCCLVFTCLEFLKGSVDSALVHIESGFQILTNISASGDMEDDDIAAIERYIVPMFSRLNTHCTLFERFFPPAYKLFVTEDGPHTDIADSRQKLFEILDPALRFISSSGRKSVAFELDIEDYVEQVKFQTIFKKWLQGFNELLDHLASIGQSPSDEVINLLLINHKTVSIWLAVCTSEQEIVTDNHVDDFADIVQYAERIFAARDWQRRPDPLSFDMEVIGPLYYTAIKCRNSAIRRRAQYLLNFAPRREGLWNAHLALKTAERVIDLEERAVDEHQMPVETSRMVGIDMPKDESRIYNLGGLPAEFRRIDANIVPHAALPGAIEVTFQTKPWGVLGPFHTIREYVVL